MTKIKKKSNQCGTNSETCGVRTANLIFGQGHVIGFPVYSMETVLEEVKNPLSDLEFEVFVRCLGINDESKKETQRSVAESLGLTPEEVSLLIKKIAVKIKRNCGSKLKELILEPNDAVEEIIRLRQENAILRKENTALRKSNRNSANNESENAKLKANLENANKLNTYLASKLRRTEVERKTLEDKLAEANKEKDEALREKSIRDLQITVLLEELSRENLTTKMLEAKMTLEYFGFSEEAMSALARAKILNLETLVRMNRYSLRKLGISNEIIREIEEKLGRYGYRLKAS